MVHCGRRDEERFGLEYDLDVYNIVAVSDFNMGGQCFWPLVPWNLTFFSVFKPTLH